MTDGAAEAPFPADLEPLLRPIDQCRTMEGNPRRGNIDAVARSLRQFGQRKPVIGRLDADGMIEIIAGNHTYLAAVELGWTDLAVVVVADDDATAKAFALADNRTHDVGDYDDELLTAMLEDIASHDVLLDATGYTVEDLEALTTLAEPYTPFTNEAKESEASAKRREEQVTGYVVFRLGDLRAKVDRTAYENLVEAMLSTVEGRSISEAGRQAAIRLGLDDKAVVLWRTSDGSTDPAADSDVDDNPDSDSGSAVE